MPRREVFEEARERLADVREYRPPPRTELLRLPGRDLRRESLDALSAWSRETAGKLACTDYMRWRRGRKDAPSRNTVVRQFGSWRAALEAAGLAPTQGTIYRLFRGGWAEVLDQARMVPAGG